MRRRDLLTAAAALAWAAPAITASAPKRRPPNFIVILCDDLGYGDTGIYGAGLIPTPNLLRMAREGTVLTDYYAPANICTPSRAGLLTGRYPVRTGLGYEVIMQNDDRGLPLSEVTIASALKASGYATALFGKWHLGHRGEAWPPTRHGFDSFFGIPYSHDMSPLALAESHAGSDAVTTTPVVFDRLQQDFYAHAEAFITANAARPFFVELALSSPHLPEHPPAGSNAKTAAGPYGAVVTEIDGVVGRLLAKLRALKLDRDTLVIFTSDNGPWFEGSAGTLRDRKGGAGYDGGYRVPFVAWRPGAVPAGRRNGGMAMGVDLLPTFLAMSGTKPPRGLQLDGRDLTPMLLTGALSPHDEIVLFDNETPVAIRTQRWKYVAATHYRAIRLPVRAFGYDELYDLQADPGERYSVAAAHPEVVKDMRGRLDRATAAFAPYRHKDIPPAFKALRETLAGMQD